MLSRVANDVKIKYIYGMIDFFIRTNLIKEKEKMITIKITGKFDFIL